MSGDSHLKTAVITLFPEMLSSVTEFGISGRAVQSGLCEIRAFNPREYATDRHKTVDDRPYGGGPGMVMRIQPLADALSDAKHWLCEGHSESPQRLGGGPHVVYLSPQGRRLTAETAQRLSRKASLVLIAGRYEGIDQRFIDAEVDEELSIGDYVLSGGELPAMVLLDAMIRRLPGALGDDTSAEEDSFEGGVLDCPHYTRPEEYRGRQVPKVLLSGDHKKIAEWRQRQGFLATAEKRPDLLEGLDLTQEQQAWLDEWRAGQTTLEP